jgi:hypothetical protein
MERRMWGGTLVLICSFVVMAGSASAHAIVSPQAQKAEAANCKINTLPGLMRQGEFGNVGSVGDIVSVECNPAVFPGGTQLELSDAQLESRCLGLGAPGENHGILWEDPNEFSSSHFKFSFGGSTTVELDGDGNVNVALVAGPNCAVGGTVISGHTEVGKGNTTVESFAAGFAVEPAKPSTEGVTVMPTTEVEDEASSSVATLIQVESGSTEAKVRVAAPELFSRCEVPGEPEEEKPEVKPLLGGAESKVVWLRPNFSAPPLSSFGEGKEIAGGTELVPGHDEALKTDNDGNAFVIVEGEASCKPGKSYFEADLEEAPFTTEEPSFTILAPEPTKF